MKKILLLGATGVLGEAFTKELSKHNHLYIADNNLTALREISSKNKIKYEYCNVLKKNSIKSVKKQGIFEKFFNLFQKI